MNAIRALRPPSPRERVEFALHQLGLRQGHFFLSGSVPMALREMRHVGDIDIGVTTEYWFELERRSGDHPWEVMTPDPDDAKRRCDPPFLERELKVGRDDYLKAHVFFAWRLRGYGDTDYNEIFRNLEYVYGWPCITLRHLLRLKSAIARDKDFADISMLAAQIYAEEKLGRDAPKSTPEPLTEFEGWGPVA